MTAKRRRPPRTAAVTITCADGGYGGALERARREIDLAQLGIGSVRIRKAATGAMVVEVPGTEGLAKADALSKSGASPTGMG